MRLTDWCVFGGSLRMPRTGKYQIWKTPVTSTSMQNALIMKKIIIFICVLLLAYLIHGYVKGFNKAIELNRQKQALEDATRRVEAMSVPELIDYIAPQYGTDPEDIKKVAWCESSYRPHAVGDGGKARNVMQFHEPTFNEFSKKLGEELNYNSAYDQIKLASYMFSQGKQFHWTCAKLTSII